MSSYIKFETEEGDTVLVEVETREISLPAGTQKAGLQEKIQDTFAVAKETFELAISRAVRYNTQAFVNAIRSLDVPPHEAEINFGLKATGEIGNFMITKASGEVNYNVKLLWKFEPKK